MDSDLINQFINLKKTQYSDNERKIELTQQLIQTLENSISKKKETLLELKNLNETIQKNSIGNEQKIIQDRTNKIEKKKKISKEIQDSKTEFDFLANKIKLEKDNFFDNKKKNINILENDITNLKELLQENDKFFYHLNHKIEIENGFFKMKKNIIDKKIQKLKNDFDESYIERFSTRTQNLQNIINFKNENKKRKIELNKNIIKLEMEKKKKQELDTSSELELQNKIIEVNQKLKEYKNNSNAKKSFNSQIIKYNQEIKLLEYNIKNKKNKYKKIIQKLQYEINALQSINKSKTQNCLNTLNTNSDYRYQIKKLTYTLNNYNSLLKNNILEIENNNIQKDEIVSNIENEILEKKKTINEIYNLTFDTEAFENKKKDFILKIDSLEKEFNFYNQKNNFYENSEIEKKNNELKIKNIQKELTNEEQELFLQKQKIDCLTNNNNNLFENINEKILDNILFQTDINI